MNPDPSPRRSDGSSGPPSGVWPLGRHRRPTRSGPGLCARLMASGPRAVDDLPVVGQGPVEPGRIVGSGLQRRSTLVDHLANREVAVGRVTHQPAVLGQLPLQRHGAGCWSRWSGQDRWSLAWCWPGHDGAVAIRPEPDGHTTSAAKASGAGASGAGRRRRIGSVAGRLQHPVQQDAGLPELFLPDFGPQRIGPRCLGRLDGAEGSAARWRDP